MRLKNEKSNALIALALFLIFLGNFYLLFIVWKNIFSTTNILSNKIDNLHSNNNINGAYFNSKIDQNNEKTTIRIFGENLR